MVTQLRTRRSVVRTSGHHRYHLVIHPSKSPEICQLYCTRKYHRDLSFKRPRDRHTQLQPSPMSPDPRDHRSGCRIGKLSIHGGLPHRRSSNLVWGPGTFSMNSRVPPPNPTCQRSWGPIHETTSPPPRRSNLSNTSPWDHHSHP